MDMDALIDEICRRVQQKIQALENRTEDTKPAILILTGGMLSDGMRAFERVSVFARGL